MTRETRSQGNVFYANQEVRVVARERIKVTAGEFDPFRIEVSGWAVGEGVNSQFTNTLWLQPDVVRSPILGEWRNQAGPKILRSDRQELISYKQS